MLRTLALVVLISPPASAKSHDSWIGLAKLWIRDVPERLLSSCLKSTGATGAVVVRMNALGDLSLEAVRGGDPVRRCAQLVGLRLGTSEVAGGISVFLYFGSPSDAGIDPLPPGMIVDEWRPHPADEPFGPCASHEHCGLGELCERSQDGGLCVDMRAILRRENAFPPVGPASPNAVHVFPRSDAHCANVASKSDRTVIRVVSRSLKPLHAELLVAEFDYQGDGGVQLEHAPEPIELGKGRGFSPRKPMMVFSKLEGCRSTTAVIEPNVSACVLLVVHCPAWLEQ